MSVSDLDCGALRRAIRRVPARQRLAAIAGLIIPEVERLSSEISQMSNRGASTSLHVLAQDLRAQLDHAGEVIDADIGSPTTRRFACSSGMLAFDARKRTACNLNSELRPTA